MSSSRHFLIVAVVTAFVSTAQADVLFVDDDAPPGGDGLSWDTAYRFLQDALANAVSATEIRVAQGAYLPDRDEANPSGTGDPDTTFQLLDGVALLGGFAGLGAPDPDARDIETFVSVLSGDVVGDDDLFPESCCSPHGTPGCENPDFFACDLAVCNELPFCCQTEWDLLCVAMAFDTPTCDFVTQCPEIVNNAVVVTGSGTDPTALIDGFRVTRGLRGMFIEAGDPTIANCTFSDNRASGLRTSDGSPTIADCTFVGNASSLSGGGLRISNGNATITGCVFTGNASANSGGGMSTSGANPTVTDCTFTGNRVFRGGGGMSIYAGDPSVTNCTFTGNSAAYIQAHGGGLVVSLGSPQIVGCTFVGNSVPWVGGGLCIGTFPAAGGSPLVVDCVFSGNTVTGPVLAGSPGGAGAASWSASSLFVGCTFENNIADNGAGLGSGGGFLAAGALSPTLVDCVFRDNLAVGAGGALFFQQDAEAVVIGCTLIGNSTAQGGGAYFSFSAGPTMINCAFMGNTATESGGAVYNRDSQAARLVNCALSGNVAGGFGGAIYSLLSDFATENLDVVNCSFSSNQAAVGGGIYNLLQGAGDDPMKVTNAVLWGDSPDEIAGPHPPLVSYSNVQGGFPGTGNIDADPLFVNPGNNDFRLSAGSPCIDAGDNTAVPQFVLRDLDGNPRFAADACAGDSGATVDMGAYEFQGSCCVVGNIMALLAAWGMCDDCGKCASDFDGDCSVGILDLLILLGNQG